MDNRNKTKVVVVDNDSLSEYKVGDYGYIDGYVRGGDDRPYAVVVIDKRFVMCPLNSIKVPEII